MSDSNGNGNVLNHKVNELIKWKEEQHDLFRETIQPFINKTNAICEFVEDHKDRIKELNIMQKSIDDLHVKFDKQDAHKRQMTYLLWGAVITGIAIPIIMRLL